MGLKQFNTSLETVGKEVVDNLKNQDNAILLVSGTDTPDGIMTRIYCNNPHKVAALLYGHAIETGNFKLINEMIFHLRRIADTTEQLIEKDLKKKGRQN